jgi:predicted membrane protein
MFQKNDSNVMNVQSDFNFWDDVLLTLLPIVFYLVLFISIFYVLYKFYSIFKKMNNQLESINETLKNKDK